MLVSSRLFLFCPRIRPNHILYLHTFFFMSWAFFSKIPMLESFSSYTLYLHAFFFYLFWVLTKSIFLLTDIWTVEEGECSSTSCVTQGSFPSVPMLLHDLSFLNHQSPQCMYSSCCRHSPGIDLLSAFCFHHWMLTTLDRFEVPPLIMMKI